MWRSFVALNWPAVPIVIEGDQIIEGYRGEPLAEKGAIFEQKGRGQLPYYSVWETYKQPREVFPQDSLWDPFPSWNTPPPRPGQDFPKTFGDFFSGFLEYATDLNQPDFFPNPTGPLLDQDSNYVRYEVTINEAFYTYITHFKYYDAGHQIKSVAESLADPSDLTNGFQRPPHGTKEELTTGYLRDLPPFAQQGMVDVKAAWRVLDTTKGHHPERYLHHNIVINEAGDEKMLGLVALHILRYTPDGQVACTFEQVDNVSVGRDAPAGLTPSFNDGSAPNSVQRRLGFEGDFPAAIPKGAPIPPKSERSPVSVYRTFPLSDQLNTINQQYQDLLAGSVFQYYELIGTQNKHTGVPPKVSFQDSTAKALNGPEGPLTGVYTNTGNLVNTALESYTQKNHSCIQCHVQARPKGVPTQAKEVDHFKILTFLLNNADTFYYHNPVPNEKDVSYFIERQVGQ